MNWLPTCSGKRWSGLKDSALSKKQHGKRKPPRNQSIRLGAQVHRPEPKNRIPNVRVYRNGLRDKNATEAVISRSGTSVAPTEREQWERIDTRFERLLLARHMVEEMQHAEIELLGILQKREMAHVGFNQ